LLSSSSAGQPAGSPNQTKMVFLNTTNLSGKTAVYSCLLQSMSVCLCLYRKSMQVPPPSTAAADIVVSSASTSSCSMQWL
jgi:hypothetical protein